MSPDDPRSDAPPAALRERLEEAGQGHALAGWGGLDAAARERLAADLEAVDLELVRELAARLSAPPAETGPPPALAPERLATRADVGAAELEAAREHLAAGRTAYLLVAGGQASRLGYDGPKGCFPVGPVSGRSLFELHARRLAAARRRFGATPWWYVMTSPANDAATRAFFAEHGFFGLDPEGVVFFEQRMLPALDLEGRLVLAAPDRLFRAPDGHGGVLGALARSGALAHARERGVETFSYFQVDNPLVRPADEEFLALHLAAGAEMSSKVVYKRDAAEKVGVIGRVDGRLACIEYSDLPAELREARDGLGRLRWRAGNIAVHLLQRAFVEELTRAGLELPWHLARKRLPAVEPETGRAVEREGVKFETFVFDALSRTRASVTLVVDRALEFSPVKNRTGPDSPASCRADLGRLHADWVRTAGLALPPEPDGLVEVDPLLAESAAELAAAGPLEPRVVAPGRWLYEAPSEPASRRGPG